MSSAARIRELAAELAELTVTQEEAAAELDLNPASIRARVHRGRIRYVRLPGQVLIARDALNRPTPKTRPQEDL